MTLGNDNGTDGQTDGVRRNMRPPPREEGRITNISYYMCYLYGFLGGGVSLQPPSSLHLSNFCWWGQTSVLGGGVEPPTPLANPALFTRYPGRVANGNPRKSGPRTYGNPCSSTQYAILHPLSVHVRNVGLITL